MSPFATLIQLIEFISGIQHIITVFVKWVLTAIFHLCFLSPRYGILVLFVERSIFRTDEKHGILVLNL